MRFQIRFPLWSFARNRWALSTGKWRTKIRNLIDIYNEAIRYSFEWSEYKKWERTGFIWIPISLSHRPSQIHGVGVDRLTETEHHVRSSSLKRYGTFESSPILFIKIGNYKSKAPFTSKFNKPEKKEKTESKKQKKIRKNLILKRANDEKKHAR